MNRLQISFWLLLVPDYDITEPYPSQDENNGQRQKRSLQNDDNFKEKFYKMKVFDEELPLQLSLNQQLMPPDMRVEIKRSDGTTDYHPAPENTFHLGTVLSDPESMVAVSHAEGMVRTKKYVRIWKKQNKWTSHMSLGNTVTLS